MNEKEEQEEKKVSFVFYESWYDGCKVLNGKHRLLFLEAIINFGLYGEESELEGVENALFLAIKPTIKFNKKQRENGLKGGGTQGNSNAKKTTQKRPKNDPKMTNILNDRDVDVYIDKEHPTGVNKKNNNSAPSVRTRYEKIFEDVFLNRTGQPFSWNKREAIAVNSIIGKIEKIMLGQNRVPTPDVKADGFRWFLEKLYDTGDGWITSNFVPHVINDKFNEYYLTIKNGRNGKQNNDNPSNVSEEWLRAILTRNV